MENEMRYLWSPEHQFLYDNGAILAGGNVKVYIYESTTLADLYNVEGVRISNPVILDSNGRAAVVASTEHDYIIEVRDIDNELIYTAIAYLHSNSGVVDIISSNNSIGITKSEGGTYDLRIEPGEYVYFNGNEINVRHKPVKADQPLYLTKSDDAFHIGIDASAFAPNVSGGTDIIVNDGVVSVLNENCTDNKDYLALAIGRNTTGYGYCSVAMGEGTLSNGAYSIVQGNGSKAFGDTSIAIGADNESDGAYSLSFGNYNSAFSDFGVTLGNHNGVENGVFDYAVGSDNNIQGANFSYALGQNNTISGNENGQYANYILGSFNEANGGNNFLIGNNLISNSAASWPSIYLGTFNEGNSDTMLEVGMGVGGRKNVIEVKLNGDLLINNKNNDNDKINITKNLALPKYSFNGTEYNTDTTEFWHFRKQLYLTAANEDSQNTINLLPTFSDSIPSGIPLYASSALGVYKLDIAATVKGGYNVLGDRNHATLATVQPRFNYTGCANVYELYEGFPNTADSQFAPLNRYHWSWILKNTNGAGPSSGMVQLNYLDFYAEGMRWNCTQSTQSAFVNVTVTKIADYEV